MYHILDFRIYVPVWTYISCRMPTHRIRPEFARSSLGNKLRCLELLLKNLKDLNDVWSGAPL